MTLTCPVCGSKKSGTNLACGGSKAHPHRPELMVPPAEVSGQIELAELEAA